MASDQVWRVTEALNVNADVVALIEAGHWDVAAILLRRMLVDQPKDTGVRILFGDCLLQLGQFAMAEQAYQSALPRPEGFRGLARVARARNRFDEALVHYQGVLKQPEFKPDDKAQATEAVSAIKSAWPRQADVLSGQLTIVFSGLSFLGVPAIHWGRDKAFWRYAPIAQAYMSALDAAGLAYRVVAHPEYIADAADEFGTADCIHLRIAPPDNPRLLKGAYNILICPATMADLPVSRKERHPFADWMTLIEAFDEVWAPTRYSLDVLLRHTRAKALLAPPPIASLENVAAAGGSLRRREIGPKSLRDQKFIPLSVFPRIQSRFSEWSARQAQTLSNVVEGMMEKPRVFLAVLIQGDSRQQVRAMVEAFTEHALMHPEALLLIVYMAIDLASEEINLDIARHHLELPDRLLETLCSDQIWICADRWSSEELSELYSMTHFFIGCPSIEGHFQLLVDAMAHGCVPIMPRHSGLCEIISEGGAIIIASAPMDDLQPGEMITADGVSDALAQAGSLTDEAYVDLQGRVVAAAERIYGWDSAVDPFRKLVNMRCATRSGGYR